jgi:hypothetical protein
VARLTQDIIPFIMGCVLWSVEYSPENCEKAYLSMLLALGAFSKIVNGIDILALSLHSVGLFMSPWSFCEAFDEASWSENVGKVPNEHISAIYGGQNVEVSILERLTLDTANNQEPRVHQSDIVEKTTAFIERFFVGTELETVAYSVACTFARNMTSPRQAALYIGTNTFPRLSQLFEGLKQRYGENDWAAITDLETAGVFFVTLRLMVTPMLAGGLGMALMQHGAREEDVNALSAHYDRWIAHEGMELDDKLADEFGRACAVAFWYARRINGPEGAMAVMMALKKRVEHESNEDEVPKLFNKAYLTLFQSLALMMKAEYTYQYFLSNGFVPVMVDLYTATEDPFVGRMILDTFDALIDLSPAEAVVEFRKVKELRDKIMRWWSKLDSDSVMAYQTNARRFLEKIEKKDSELQG